MPMYLANGLVEPHAREELKAFVRDRLEPYQHPREVSFIESLPTMQLRKVGLGPAQGDTGHRCMTSPRRIPRIEALPLVTIL